MVGDLFIKHYYIMLSCNFENFDVIWRLKNPIEIVSYARSPLPFPHNAPYYSFKIFPQFWMAKSTCLIHHNQLLMTKFGGIMTLKSRENVLDLWLIRINLKGGAFTAAKEVQNSKLGMWKWYHFCYFNFFYNSFKIFPRFWLAKSTHLIHHNQFLMTKFGRNLTLTRKWRQKCSFFAG